MDISALRRSEEPETESDNDHRSLSDMTANSFSIIAAFDDWKHGQQALHDLLEEGVSRDQAGMVARGGEAWIWDIATRKAGTAVELGANATDFWSLDLAAGMVKGMGPVLTAGLFKSIFEDGSPCSLPHALTWAGISGSDADYVEEQLKSGRIVLIVEGSERIEEIISILDVHDVRSLLIAEVQLASGDQGRAIRRELVEISD
jgi:hypothetical protein